MDFGIVFLQKLSSKRQFSENQLIDITLHLRA